MPNGIMERFFKKVSQKLNLGRPPMPNACPPARPPRHRCYKGFLKIPSNKGAKIALYHSPEYQTSFESTGLSVPEKQFNIHFQDDSCDGHLGFPIRMILAIYFLSTPILPNKFQVNWPFVSGKEVQNRFSKWPPW